MAPTTAAETGLGLARSTIDWIERAAVVSTAGMTPKVNSRLGFPDVGRLRRTGDTGNLVLGADRIHRELHAAGVCAEDGVHTVLGDQPRRGVGSGRGIALAVLHDQVDLILLVADGQSACLVHRVGPHLVSALGDLAARRRCPGQLEHGADLERVGRLTAATAVAAARGEEARAHDRAADHKAGSGDEASTVDVAGHGDSSLSCTLSPPAEAGASVSDLLNTGGSVRGRPRHRRVCLRIGSFPRRGRTAGRPPAAPRGCSARS